MKLSIKIFTLFLFVFLLDDNCNATIWRVNGNVGIDANFSGLQAAIDSASSGDTIIVEPILASGSYGNIAINKQLTLYGNGVYLSANDSTQANLANSKIGDIALNTSAQGTIISGCYITGEIGVFTSNTIIERNYFNGSYTSTKVPIELNSAHNTIIRHNFIENSTDPTHWVAIYFQTGSSTSVMIHNNYINGGSHPNTTYLAIDMRGSSFGNAFIFNNVIVQECHLYNSSFYNNIVTTIDNFTMSNVNFNNNISAGTQFGTLNGNIENVAPDSVFVDWTGAVSSGGKRYRIKTGSPAVNAGADSSDCGMFGGLNPYRLSLLPAIPAIFYLYTDPSGSNTGGLNVRVKAKAHN